MTVGQQGHQKKLYGTLLADNDTGHIFLDFFTQTK